MNKKQKNLRYTIAIVILFSVIIIAFISIYVFNDQRHKIPLKQVVEQTCFDVSAFPKASIDLTDTEQLADRLISNLEEADKVPGQQLRQLDQTKLKQDLIQQIEQLQKYKLLSDDDSSNGLSMESKAHLANALGTAVTNQLGNPKSTGAQKTISDVVDLSTLEKNVKELNDVDLQISYKDYGMSQKTNDKTETTQTTQNDDMKVLRLRMEALETLVNSIKNTPLNTVSTDELQALRSQFDSKVTNLQSQIHTLNSELSKSISHSTSPSETLKSMQAQITALTTDIKRNEDTGTSIQKELQGAISSIHNELSEKQTAIEQISNTLMNMQNNIMQSGQIEQMKHNLSSELDSKLSDMNKDVETQVKEIQTFLNESLAQYEKDNDNWITDANVLMRNLQNDIDHSIAQMQSQSSKLDQNIKEISESTVWDVDVCLSKDQWILNEFNQYVYEYHHPSIDSVYTNIYINYLNPREASGMNYEQTDGLLSFIRTQKPEEDIQIISIKLEQPGREDRE
ncbi:MAG: hypothetical protein PUD20_01835 [bacterium]|nr:hypothetical protein [bacterium]